MYGKFEYLYTFIHTAIEVCTSLHTHKQFGLDDSEEEDYYYKDKFYADSLLRQFADKLYRNYNGPGRSRKPKGGGWQGWC